MVRAVSSINTMACPKCSLSTIQVTRERRTLHILANRVMHVSMIDPDLQEWFNQALCRIREIIKKKGQSRFNLLQECALFYSKQNIMNLRTTEFMSTMGYIRERDPSLTHIQITSLIRTKRNAFVQVNGEKKWRFIRSFRLQVTKWIRMNYICMSTNEEDEMR